MSTSTHTTGDSLPGRHDVQAQPRWLWAAAASPAHVCAAASHCRRHRCAVYSSLPSGSVPSVGCRSTLASAASYTCPNPIHAAIAVHDCCTGALLLVAASGCSFYRKAPSARGTMPSARTRSTRSRSSGGWTPTERSMRAVGLPRLCEPCARPQCESLPSGLCRWGRRGSTDSA